MAKFRYQHIKSSVEGKAPTSSQLKVGEIGVNDFASDEKLFIKNSENEVVDFPRGYSRQYIDEQQETVAASLNDLEERKLDASAYTPTDLTNYYTKSETSGATEIQNALDGKLDASAYTPIDLSDYYTKEEMDEQQETVAASLNDLEERKANESDLEEIGETTAYALNDLECRKADKEEFDEQFEAIAASLNDLEERKLDASAYTPTDLTNYYTKSETSGATEIQNALDGKLDSSSIDQVIDSTTSASTGAVSTSAVYDFVTAYAPSITVDNIIDNTTSASTNAVSTSAVYKCINDNELVVSTAVNNLEENKADREEDLDGIKLKKITQSAYDALVQAGTVDPNTLYIITD